MSSRLSLTTPQGVVPIRTANDVDGNAVVAHALTLEVNAVATPVSASNPVPVSISTASLPTGAATAALQPALHADGGALAHVTNLPATQAVSGTVGISGTVPVSGTFWQATQPISAASLPLPTGAATSAKQPALGVAGTASADVLTVQGIASMTALKVDGSAVTQPVSGTVGISGTVAATQSGAWNIGSITTLPSLPTGANTIGAVTVNGTVPVSGTFWQATQPVSLSTLPTLPSGSNTIGAVTGSGTFTVAGGAAAGSPPTAPPLSISGVDGSGNKQHLLTDTSGRVAVNVNGTVGIAPAPQAGSSYGIAPSFTSVAGSALVAKASAGNLYQWTCTAGAVSGFLMVFNATSAPADGAVTPVDVVVVPANTTVAYDVAGGPPDYFGTGITLVFSSAGPFTKTASATAFIKAKVQ